MTESYRRLVITRAGGACEYCRLLEAASGVTFIRTRRFSITRRRHRDERLPSWRNSAGANTSFAASHT
jgi:hypothetical protein